MNSLLQVFRRIGSPAAVSWPTFWVSFGFNVFLVFLGSFDAEATQLQRLTTLFTSQFTMFGFLLLCRATVLAHADVRPRPWTTFACFIAAGIIRSLTAGVLAVAFLGPDSARPAFRLVAGIIVGAVVFVPTTIIVATWREYRQRRADLVARQIQLEAAAHQLVTQIVERDREVMDRIRTEINDVLVATDPEHELQRLSAEVVRPMSHQLAAEIPTWSPPGIAPQKVRVTSILARVVTGAPLLPLTTALTVGTIALLPIWLAAGWPAVGPYTVLAATIALVLLWLTNVALRALTPVIPVGGRAVVLVAALLVIGFQQGLMAQSVLTDVVWTVSVLPGYVILYVLFGLGYALARSASNELHNTMAQLVEADAELTWRVSRLRLLQWAQSSRFARALHGPVQAIIAQSAVRLKESPEQREHILESLRNALVNVLEGRESLHDRSWNESVALMHTMWQGVCEVHVQSTDVCVRSLDADVACREMAVEIMSEAISNAVRHGQATRVVARMECDGTRATLTVTDNGRGEEVGSPGLGTRMLDACTLRWERDPAPGATTLVAVLPAAPDLRTETSRLA
jgi:hypothetical protein